MSRRERPLFCNSVRIFMLDNEGNSVGRINDEPIGLVGQHYHLHRGFPSTETNHIVLGRVLGPTALMEAFCDACAPNTRMHGLLIDGADLDPVLHQSVQLSVPRMTCTGSFGSVDWATGNCETYRDWVPDWLPDIGGPPATARQHRRIRIRRE